MAKLEAAMDTLGDVIRQFTFIQPLSADPSDVAAAYWENLQRGAVPGYDGYDEDDDL